MNDFSGVKANVAFEEVLDVRLKGLWYRWKVPWGVGALH